ncbi:MAG: polysulfide reductase NrfD [Desulfohalobiaceae bacterium]|nr:polysulfide reductase NrfD [Desulfohalobiaceae bacterium]
MLDEPLLPEGVQRCSPARFLVWITLLVAVVIWGAVAAFLIFGWGLGVTGLNNYFGFGLWITFDLAVIALGAGAFFSGFLKYILGIDELKNIINLAVIVGFLCYSGAMMLLVLDIGQPLRAWFGYWHANVHSMLTEVIFCITCYLIVLTIEFIPIILENRQIHKISLFRNLAHNFHIVMPLFAAVGTFLSFFHQGSLGGMYGVLFGRPFALREGFFIWPWTFFLFILSAIASGPVFTMLISRLMESFTRRSLVPYSTKELLGKISGFLLCIYLFFKFLDTWAWATGVLPRSGFSFEEMFNQVYGQWLLWLELGLCGVVPAIMLVVPTLRSRPGLLYAASFLTCAGVVVNRFVFTVQTLAIPVMPFDQWYTYIPNWTEWATSAMVVSYSAIVVSLAHRYLPLFPKERQLNA